MKARAILFSMLFVLWFCPSLFSADYPIDKGSVMIDGSGMFSSSGSEDADDRLTEIMLNAGVSFFVIPNLSIGGNLTLEHASYGSETATLLGMGPKLAYYFGDRDSRTYPFVGASLTYNGYSNHNDYTAFFLNFGAGVVHMLNDYVALMGRGFFQLGFYDFDGEGETINSFGILAGIAAFIY